MWHNKANFRGRIINVVQFLIFFTEAAIFPVWNYGSLARDVDPLGQVSKRMEVEQACAPHSACNADLHSCADNECLISSLWQSTKFYIRKGVAEPLMAFSLKKKKAFTVSLRLAAAAWLTG